MMKIAKNSLPQHTAEERKFNSEENEEIVIKHERKLNNSNKLILKPGKKIINR